MTASIPSHMRAIEIKNPGRKTGELHVKEIATPTLKPHDVLIHVHTAGVNRADVLQRMGLYPPPEGVTEIPGLEAAGKIIAVGEKVSEWKIGDHVCALLAGGGYAEFATAYEGHVLPIPDGWSMEEAAALPEALFTVWMALGDAANIQKGQNVLIHGGASGIGMIAIQMCAALGAEVYTTAGAKEKCDACLSWGAKHAINYKENDFEKIILDDTKNEGVDVILDMVGGDYISKNFSCIKLDGAIITIGFLGGAKLENFSATPILRKRITWKGVTLRTRSDEQKKIYRDAIAKRLWPLIEQRMICPKIDEIYTYAHSKKSHIRMENNLNIGKIVLQMM